MEILIIGATKSGKSKLGDLIRNTIFKLDENSKITTSDPDRENKTFGDGKNVYNIEIMQVLAPSSAMKEALGKDVVIILSNDSVNQWFSKVYEK